MGAFSTGLAIQGAARGLADVNESRRANEDRDYLLRRRSQEQQLYEQGQQEREHTLSRRGIEEGRQDTEYQRSTEAKQRTDDANNAFFGIMSGNPQPVKDFFNKWEKSGNQYDMVVDKEGNWEITVTLPDGTKSTQKTTADNLGAITHTAASQDPYAATQASAAGRLEGEAKQADIDLKRAQAGKASRWQPTGAKGEKQPDVLKLATDLTKTKIASGALSQEDAQADIEENVKLFRRLTGSPSTTPMSASPAEMPDPVNFVAVTLEEAKKARVSPAEAMARADKYFQENYGRPLTSEEKMAGWNLRSGVNP